MVINRLTSLPRIILGSSLLHWCRIMKVSYIIGSFGGLFSATNIIAPALGITSGLSSLLAASSVQAAVMWLLQGANPFWFLVYHIPHLCAALVWRTERLVLRVGLPLLCAVLFVVHPIGMQNWYYALLWILPIVCAFDAASILKKSFMATMTAHAVGTVVWLYTMPLVVPSWLALMPITLIERSLFALGITGICYALPKISTWFTTAWLFVGKRSCHD